MQNDLLLKVFFKRRLLAFLSLVFILSITACTEQAEDSSSQDEVSRPVKSQVIKASAFSSSRRYPATVAASKKVPLAFQVQGQLIKFPAQKGFVIKEGELLGQLDPRDYQHDLDEEKAKYIQAKTDYLRFAELVKTGSISKVRFDEKKSAYGVAKAKLATVKKALDDTSLEAPFSGIVANTFVDNYQNVKAKEVVLSLQDISKIEIIINVPERDFFEIEEDISSHHGQFTKKDIASVVFDSLPNKKFPVTLKEFSAAADETTQTYEVVFTLDNPDDLNIFPGMSATVIPYTDDTDDQQYEIPVNAVFADEAGNSYVWLVSPETSTTIKKQVTIGNLVEDKIVIIKGLSSGDEIVTAGVDFLREGARVRTMQPASGE